MEVRRTSDILADVVNACQWFEEIGIPTTSTRPEAIRNYLHGLLDTTTPAAALPGVDATEEDVYYVLSDGDGFGRIATEMKKLSPQLSPQAYAKLKDTLRDILKGPLAASQEKTSTNDNDARNKFVELELAAHFASAGFRIIGFEDLKFEFEGHHYLVECKRPFSQAKLDDNIEHGYTQLKRELGPTERGIVAVAVEKVFGLDQRTHEGESTASAFALSIAKQFRDEIKRADYEHTWLDTRVVGLLAIIRFLVKTRVPEPPRAVCYIPALVKFGGLPAESQRLDRMMEALRSRFLAF
jgi:hypothetical protein